VKNSKTISMILHRGGGGLSLGKKGGGAPCTQSLWDAETKNRPRYRTYVRAGRRAGNQLVTGMTAKTWGRKKVTKFLT